MFSKSSVACGKEYKDACCIFVAIGLTIATIKNYVVSFVQPVDFLFLAANQLTYIR